MGLAQCRCKHVLTAGQLLWAGAGGAAEACGEQGVEGEAGAQAAGACAQAVGAGAQAVGACARVAASGAAADGVVGPGGAVGAALAAWGAESAWLVEAEAGCVRSSAERRRPQRPGRLG